MENDRMKFALIGILLIFTGLCGFWGGPELFQYKNVYFWGIYSWILILLGVGVCIEGYKTNTHPDAPLFYYLKAFQWLIASLYFLIFDTAWLCRYLVTGKAQLGLISDTLLPIIFGDFNKNVYELPSILSWGLITIELFFGVYFLKNSLNNFQLARHKND